MKLKFNLRLRAWVHAPDGKKKKVIDRRSRSFIQPFIDNIGGSWSDNASFSVFKDTSGTNRSAYINNQIDAAAGVVDYGTVIGNGYADVAIDNYALNSRMGSGNGAGQMGYPKQAITSIDTSVAGKRSFEIMRYFANLYVLPQIVRECGIYVKVQGSSIYYCFVRDLLGALEIPPQGGISIYYKFEIAV